MRVLLARNSGFCFGVRRAIEMAERALKERGEGGRVCSYGKLIHNEGVVETLKERGIVPIFELGEAVSGDTVIIRAHGAPRSATEELEARGVNVVDATCPFVKRIHRIAAGCTGELLAVAGKSEHPEVVGICGHASGRSVVIGSSQEALRLPYEDRVCLVAQTTLQREKYREIEQTLRERCGKLTVHDTICDTTLVRQQEAEDISRRCTKVYVLGSESSANTRALLELCKKNCNNSQIIENIGKISLAIFDVNDIIGFVAGASTPDVIIREVIQVMSELENTTIETIEAEAPAEVVAETNQVEAVAVETAPETTPEAEAEACPVTAAVEPAAETVVEEVEDNSNDFRKAFEKTVKRIRQGQVITGTVLQIVDGEIYVNVGYKSDGIIPKGEYSIDSEVKVDELVKEGDSIDVEVVKVNDGDGNVLLSHKNVEGKKLWDEMLAEDVEGRVFDAVGKEVVKGGLIAEIKGSVRAFVPASHVSTKYVENLAEFIGKPMQIKVLEVDRQRKRIVASAKQVILDEQERKQREKWDAIVVGSKLPGVVRRITDFGAFVDIGGLDGLVHVTDCAWGRVKHPSDSLSIGQEIEVLVLGVDKEKKRISLGYKQLQPKPWTMAAEKYPVGSIVEGKVVRIVPFGAFVALEPTIDGLIHISQIAIRRIEKVEDELNVGDVVRCKVLEVNVEAKRISLSRKAATLEENPEVAEQLAAEKAERERLYQERKAQRETERAKPQTERRDRPERRPSENSGSNEVRKETRPDRRRRNSEDGDYELPPVTSTTTSLASLLANFKADEE